MFNMEHFIKSYIVQAERRHQVIESKLTFTAFMLRSELVQGQVLGLQLEI